MSGWKICPSCMGAKCKLCKNLGYMGDKPTAKFGNKKTEVDGIVFDSKAESEYYTYVKTLLLAGEVTKLELQPKYELLPKFTDREGKKNQAIFYIADFYIEYKDGRRLVIDVKGVETAEFKIKRKMYAWLANTTQEEWPELIVICFDDKFGWIELDELKKMGAAADVKAKRAKKETKQAAAGRGKSGKSKRL